MMTLLTSGYDIRAKSGKEEPLSPYKIFY